MILRPQRGGLLNHKGHKGDTKDTKGAALAEAP
jgi:hypothetical protein